MEGPVRLWMAQWSSRDEGWAWVRMTLASTLGIDDSRLRIARDPRGKPQLVEGGRDWHFSLSHSHGHALLAVLEGCPVGVDLEWPRPRSHLLALASRYFTGGEAATLAGLDASERVVAFYQLWTAKEAVLKASGLGLAHGLRRVAMHWEEGGWRPAGFEDVGAPAAAWRLRALPLPHPWIGHLAYVGDPRPIVFCDNGLAWTR